MMASLDNSQECADLTELTPVTIVNNDGEETELKVPSSSGAYHHVKQETSENDEGVFADDDTDPLDQQPEHLLYIRLQTLYRSLPKEMFISRILKNVSFSEPDLESHRAMLYELVKECDDFPYGLQAELKRRVHTRNGDSVTTKLAQDIYILVSVLEGGEFTDLKGMIASGRKGNRAHSQSQSQSGLGNVTLTSNDYATEIKSLEISLNSMKADMLGLKQQYVASEATRSSQIQNLKSTVFGLKADLSALTSTVTKAVTDITFAAQRIESEKSLGVHSLKTEVRLMKDSVRDIQDTLNNMTHGPLRRNIAATKSSKSSKKSKKRMQERCLSENDLTDIHNGNFDIASPVEVEHQTGSNSGAYEHSNNIDSNIPPAQPGITPGPHAPNETDTLYYNDNVEGGNAANLNVPSGERYIAVPAPSSALLNLDSSSDIGLGHVAHNAQTSDYGVMGTGGGGSTGGVGSTGVRPGSSVNTGGSDRTSLFHEPQLGMDTSRTEGHESRIPQCMERQPTSYSEATASSHIGQGHTYIGNVGASRGAQIPVHIAAAASNVPSELDAYLRSGEDDTRDVDSDFAQYVRRKPKRYYLGGFLSSITHDKISRYVKKRGPTPSYISIWKSKRNVNNVVIRLNVEDNGLADWVLSPTFWPPGVTCRPWLDRNERNKGRYKPPRDSGNLNANRKQLFGRSDIDDYNPFSPLRDPANLVD